MKSELFNQFKNCPLVYVPFEGFKWDNNKDSRRLLEILEIDVNKLQPITQPTHFDKIILPDESFFLEGYRKFTNEYRETIDRIRAFALKNRTPTSSKKLYFFYGSRQVGEERMAEYFKSKGYEIIKHEQRTDFDEELNLLINCDVFAAPLGSCAHNSLFLREDSEKIFIPRSFNAFTGYQQPIDCVYPINANYVDSTLSVFNVGHNSFCFIISEQLKRFFGDKWDGYNEEDFKTFLDYVKLFACQRGRSANPYEIKGYGNIFSEFMTQLKQRENLIAACNMPSNFEAFLQPTLTYLTHVHMKGSWTDGLKLDNQISNPLDQMLDVLAIRVNHPEHRIYYSVYYDEKEGWTEEVSYPTWAGVTNKRKPIYGMRIRFDEAGSKKFDILYRMHKFDGTWTDWAKNGEVIYSHGVKLNAIQIKLESKLKA